LEALFDHRNLGLRIDSLDYCRLIGRIRTPAFIAPSNGFLRSGGEERIEGR
jgi:hypothetical protein